MKGNKVLFGLFASLSLLLSAPVFAQVNTGDKLVELGPDNIAGRVTSLVVDNSDASHQTIYAGAATGGLFVRSNDRSRAPYADMWNKVTCVIDGEETVLPISHMVQGPDNWIYIATGEGYVLPRSNKFSSLSVMGRGIFRFNPTTGEFKRIPTTKPTSADHPFASVNKLALMNRDGKTYLFAATLKGLYRWVVSSASDWQTEPVCYQPDYPIYDLMAIEEANMVYFSSVGYFFRISNVSGSSEPVNIYDNLPTASETCFMRLAVSPTNPSYVYAMRIGQTGLLDGVYLTTNHSTWTLITPRSVTPFNVTSGTESGTMCVDPVNPKRIYIAGSSIYSGEGFVDGSLYTWIKNSYNEYEFGSADYMADVFSSAMFVHSGINQVVSTWQSGSSVPVYYIATDGGVFVSYNELSTFSNINKGLNNLEVNGIAVATDGSLLMGANNNANVFLESRMAHHGGMGTASWYDSHPELNTNHHGNVIWNGNGGQVAISRFQQYAPLVRRNIFTSSSHGHARASNDYNDYSNTQTWTTGTGFLSNTVANPYEVPQMALWEGDNVTTSSDTIVMEIDTLGYAIRHTEAGDEQIPLRPGTEILEGDEITVFARNNAYYPVVYSVPEAFTVEEGASLRVKNPIRSNLFIVGKKNGSMNTTVLEVYMTWMPSDFRKVWFEHTSSTAETQEDMSQKMQWARIFAVNTTTIDYTVGAMAVSNDGDHLFVAINNLNQNESMIYRISGILSKIDYAGDIAGIKSDLSFGSVSWALDTVRIGGTTMFPRCVSSIAVDPRDKNHLVVTFQGYGESGNVVDITKATKPNPQVAYKTVANNIPAYSALVEKTTGEVYIGTEDGAWVSEASSYASASPVWHRYNSLLSGVPVTAMCQQIHEMPVLHAISHIGIVAENYVFPRTKYPYAMYFGTYGRGVFMDSAYVVDHTNEVVDPSDYVGINTVASEINGIKLYPNPASDRVQVELNLRAASNVAVRIFDVNGKQVLNNNLGYCAEGTVTHTFNCAGLSRGLYLVHVTTAQGSTASKLVIR